MVVVATLVISTGGICREQATLLMSVNDLCQFEPGVRFRVEIWKHPEDPVSVIWIMQEALDLLWRVGWVDDDRFLRLFVRH
jgi:hypothetical protein